MTRFLDLVIIGVTTGSLYALCTVSFGVIYNATHIFNLAHAAVIAAAGYVAYTVSVNDNLPLVVGFFAGLVVAGIFGVACEVLLFGPMRRRRSDHRMMFLVSVGILTIFEGVFGIIYGPAALTFNALTSASVTIWGMPVPWANIWMLGAWPLILALGAYLRWSPSGRMIRAISDNSETAEAMGVNNASYYKLVFAIGSVLAAPFMLVYVWQNGLLPTTGLDPLLIATAAVILGGRRNLIFGCVWALILGLVGSISTQFVSPSWELAVVFGVTIVVLLGKSILSRSSLLVGEVGL